MAERDVAYLRGAGAEPTRLERLYYRLIANPVLSALVMLLVRLGLNRRWVVIAIPYLWLGIFFLLPFLIVLKLSFSEVVLAQPPYTPLLQWVEGALHVNLNLENYKLLLEDDLYVRSYINSLRIAAISTVFTLLPQSPRQRQAPSQYRPPCESRHRQLASGPRGHTLGWQ